MGRREGVSDPDVQETLMPEEARKVRHLLNQVTGLNDFRCTTSSVTDGSRPCKWSEASSNHTIDEETAERLRLHETNAQIYCWTTSGPVRRWVLIEYDFHQRRFNDHFIAWEESLWGSLHGRNYFVGLDRDVLEFQQHDTGSKRFFSGCSIFCLHRSSYSSASASRMSSGNIIPEHWSRSKFEAEFMSDKTCFEIECISRSRWIQLSWCAIREPGTVRWRWEKFWYKRN